MKKLLSSYKFQVGFTLIEVLIVVVIIVIIIGVGATAYSTVARNARNAQRQADLHKLADALEEYYADHGTYPNTNYGGQFEAAGRHCGFDKICCLLGGTIAQVIKYPNLSPPPLTLPSCTAPYNIYIEPKNLLGTVGSSVYSYSGLPKDPLIDPNSSASMGPGNTYAYGSDGQSYVLTTLRYEGTPPASNRFSCVFDPYYWDVANAWGPGGNAGPWENQYAIKSPQSSPVGTCT